MISQSLTMHAPRYEPFNSGHPFLNWAIDSALRVTNAPRGNLQICDPSSGMLEIVVHRHFEQAFLKFFKCVRSDGSACGKAFDSGRRVAVEDVSESPIFYRTPALEVLLDAKVRAVQSTPLVGSSGSILGVLSTHWPTPRRLSDQSLVQVDVLARAVARWLDHRLHTSNQARLTASATS